MPVLNKTWEEPDIQISDAARRQADASGADESLVMELAGDYLNSPENWVSDGPVFHRAFMTADGARTRIRIGVLTHQGLAIVSYIDCDLRESLLAEPLMPLPEEFEVDVESFDYTPRKMGSGRTVQVRIVKGKA